MNELLDSDSDRYDPDLYASLGDDARKTAREDAVTEAYEGMDPFEVRLEAERLIGEDRVPTDILREIVRDFGNKDEANDPDECAHFVTCGCPANVCEGR